MHFRMVAAAAGRLLLTAALPAQRIVSSVDVSGTGVWYADSIHSAGSSLNPALRIDWSSGTLGAFGNVSRVAGGVSAQGMLTPSIFTPSLGPFSGELAASLGGSTHPDGTRTGQTLAFARAYMNRARRWSVGRRGPGKNVGWRGVAWCAAGRGRCLGAAQRSHVVADDDARERCRLDSLHRYPGRAALSNADIRARSLARHARRLGRSGHRGNVADLGKRQRRRVDVVDVRRRRQRGDLSRGLDAGISGWTLRIHLAPYCVA